MLIIIIDKDLKKAKQLASALPHSIPGEVEVAVARSYDDTCELSSSREDISKFALADVFIVGSSGEMDYLLEQQSRRGYQPTCILWSSRTEEQKRAEEAGFPFISRRASAETVGNLIRAKDMGTAY